MENRCRAPSSLEVEGFPVVPSTSEGVWGQGSSRAHHHSLSGLLSPSRLGALLGKGSRFPRFWRVTQTSGFLIAFSLPLSFLCSWSSGYQQISIFTRLPIHLIYYITMMLNLIQYFLSLSQSMYNVTTLSISKYQSASLI